MSANPTCCLPSDPVDGVAQLMVLQNVESLPVVQDAQTSKLIDLVTDCDLTVRVVAEGCGPKGIIIEEIMTSEPMTCHPEDDVQRVLKNMVEHQLRRLPVVDVNGFLIGAIAQADITLRVATAEKTTPAVDGIPAVHLQSERLTRAKP
jgi:CBS domain-containing protein